MRTKPMAADEEGLYQLIRLVRPLFRTLYRAVEQNLQGSGVSIPMRAALECLAEAGPQTVPQISRALAVKRQVAQRIANELAAAGLVEAASNAAHARSPLLVLTGAGRSAFDAIRGRERARTAVIAAGFSAADIATCRRVMAGLIAAYATADSADGGPS